MSTEIEDTLAGLRSRIRAKRNERLQVDASIEVRRQKLAILDQEIAQIE